MQWFDVNYYFPADYGYYFIYSKINGIQVGLHDGFKWYACIGDSNEITGVTHFAIPDPIPKG